MDPSLSSAQSLLNDDIEKIRAICLDYPFREKYLIIPSYRMKGQIQKYLADQGISTVNLKIVSTGSLAMEWAEPDVLKGGYKVLSLNDVADLVGEVLAGLSARGQLQFLKDTTITPGLNRILSNGILELKKNGIGRGNIRLSLLENSKKKNDLVLIYEAYEKLLAGNHYLDHADLMEIAIENLSKGVAVGAACHILPGSRFSCLEQDMLLLLMPEEERAKAKQDWQSQRVVTPLPDPALSAKSLSFVKAYGEYNEVKEVIRRIVLHKIPLDSCLVAVTTEEPYAQLFYQLLQSYLPGPGIANARTELPVTFGTGLPVTFSNPGKLALALLKWIKYGYRAHDLISIFSSGSFNLKMNEEAEKEEDKVSPQTVIRVIKDANLKWQRNTYHQALETHKRYLERKVSETATNPETQMRYQNRLTALIWLDQTLEEDIFPALPGTDAFGKVDADRLYRGVSTIIQKYKKIIGPLDSGGYDAVLQELKGSLKTEPVLASEAVDMVLDRIKQIRTLVSDPAPGKLHLTSYRDANWIDREYTFLLGMDAGKFPGMAIENPFLLDEERMQVADRWLITSKEHVDVKMQSMERFLRSVRGQLTLSYSCFDTIDQREQFPSSLYIELRDLGAVKGNGDQQKSGQSITVERTVGFVVTAQNEAIDENDAWMHSGMTMGSMSEKVILEKLHGPHPEIAYLLSRINKSPALTGYVQVGNPATVDPRLSREVQSASVLAEYLNCRYKYLLKYLLNLKEYREKDFDTIGWLDPLESGSLFHEILEEFHKRALEDKRIRTDHEIAVKTIEEIATATIGRYEENLPTASAFHTAMKKEDILTDCKIYAMEEVERHRFYEPIRTEYRFGFDGDLVLPLDRGESIRVMGAIDRIDRLPDGKGLRIVDYKTGGDFNYRILDEVDAPLLNHKSMQPALYYLALKELTRKFGETDLPADVGEVKQAVYHFVNRKGDYKERTILFPQGVETEYKEGLRKLFDRMLTGDFGQSELEQRPGKKKTGYAAFLESTLCKYCGYKEVCSQSLLMDQVFAELADAEEEAPGKEEVAE